MADRRILVQIVGDSSSVERAFNAVRQGGNGFQDQIGGTRKSMDDLVRVSAARGKSLGCSGSPVSGSVPASRSPGQHGLSPSSGKGSR